ncbi:LysR substrate-binding domain-containing protein [Vibrio sinaloensis]|nr:LysR substrate-binding domain-containing protein [Vibrio sinaloensis]
MPFFFLRKKLTSLLHKVKRTFPDTIIHLEVETASGERMLKDDVVDIGIYAGLDLDTSQISYRCIDELKLPVYVSRSFPLSGRRYLTHKELTPYPQIVVKSSYKSSPDSGIVKQALHWYVSDHQSKKT